MIFKVFKRTCIPYLDSGFLSSNYALTVLDFSETRKLVFYANNPSLAQKSAIL
ncbi:hypothetical protein [Alysiella sp.]|uniref:hypothetical protein n=1 Tax=Alysiella sp. TaxID=1872483 RepID=UPI0026DC19F3|nr:hypothetical protein [Alysiella sp.]